ncbi:MAG: hypothetical protein JJV95_04020 [Sulfurospirillum sp.]|nr:hypothetical protein [Sulfurospirillum sp.]MBL0703128.1 hypothetical protein [Sulfurospirillum sp.]
MQLADMLEVALHFAGVKDGKISDGVDAYLESLDEVFNDNEDIAEMGVKEVIQVINSIKITHKHLFK